MNIQLEEFEKIIEYKFSNKNLLINALTHSSYAYDHHTHSNERLEFLGDSILEFISSKFLFENYSNLTEGEMTKVRATAVCEDGLYQIATKLHFEKYILLGRSELSSPNIKKAIIADSVEALIAAIFLDSNLENAQKFIERNIAEPIKIASQNVGKKDYKTVLQEKLQEHGAVSIKYTIIDEKGPDHDKSFTAQVEFNGKILASGTGRSKKDAEMEAARKALENL